MNTYIVILNGREYDFPNAIEATLFSILWDVPFDAPFLSI
jgi:hypothetical protein